MQLITRFGSHNRVASPGLSVLLFPCCCFEASAGTMSMRVQQLDVKCDTKTLDNVFVSVQLAIQFMVKPGQEVRPG